MSSSVFAAVPERYDFPQNEEEIQAFWDTIDAFRESLRLSEGRPRWTFYDGPPFATGLPHYGHILAGTIKDIVCRYAHQTGHYVSRRAGWDCHGLPVEHEIDQRHKITSRDDVFKMGIDKYNEECRAIVMRYSAEWVSTVTRMGRWIDFDNDYKTMNVPFMVLLRLAWPGLACPAWRGGPSPSVLLPRRPPAGVRVVGLQDHL